MQEFIDGISNGVFILYCGLAIGLALSLFMD
jgi:hypothetical protein